jgi:hypothetical protein
MKLSKILVHILLSALILSIATNASRSLRKIKTSSKTAVCNKVFVYSDTESQDITDSDVFPQDSQISNPTVVTNAKAQGAAARKLFSVIGTATKTKEVLVNAAINFEKFFTGTDKEYLDAKSVLVKKYDPKKDTVARQAELNGTWDHFATVINEIPELATLDDEKKRETFYLTALNEISKQTTILPSTLLGFLGLLGDAGAAYMDNTYRENKRNEFNGAIKIAIDKFFGDLKSRSDELRNYSPDIYHDAQSKLGKQKERKNCGDVVEAKKPGFTWQKRVGIMNLGAEMDTSNQVTEHALPGISWPLQTVPKKLVNYCPDEPWAGHFSGSLYELIFMLELFDRPADKLKEPATLTPEKKKIYAGLASSFLIALGMHTAVELNYVVKNYLGDGPDKVVNKTELLDKVKNCDNVSQDFKTLIEQISAPGKKKRNQKKNIKK